MSLKLLAHDLIVYFICGVVAVMVLVRIFTKLGLEKVHRPQREHTSRWVAAPCPANPRSSAGLDFQDLPFPKDPSFP